MVLDSLVHRLRFFKQNNDERTVCQCSLIKMHAFKSVACHSETNDNEVNFFCLMTKMGSIFICPSA